MSNFALTKAGTIVPATSGSVSFLASCFIMISILRSKQNTPYHRIIFFMSIWDATASLCYAVTTLPMPSDVVYDYAGPSFGNTKTCEAQSFILLVAAGFILMSNILLNIYYLCTIRYNIKQESFQKYTEPIFLMVAIPLSLMTPIHFAMKEALNPSPYYSFCLIGVYPSECLTNNEIECLRGDQDTDFQSRYFAAIPIGIQISVLIFTMLLIIHSACIKNNDSEETAAVALQAFMYISACILTWGSAALNAFTNTNFANLLFLVFGPLQGFFNLLIFVYHKVYAYKNFNNFLYTTDVIKLFLTSPEKFKDQYVSGIENIEIRNQSLRIREMHFKSQDCNEDEFHSDDGIPSRAASRKLVEGAIASIDLSIEPSSARDVEHFLDKNLDISLEDGTKQQS